MWICTRCQHHNREGDGHCIQCAAPRHARRFGVGTEVETPSVAQPAVPAPAPAPATEPAADRAAEGRAPRVDLAPPVRVVRCLSGRLLVGLGAALLMLLPALAVWLAVAQQALWAPLAGGLLFPKAVPPEGVGMWAAYGVCCLAAVLLCALPGLAAMGLGRLLIRLTPPVLVRPKQQPD